MTTEILRNALYGSGLDDLGYIVLDECHYMGDEGRGTVWEEIIVSAPSERRARRALGDRRQRQGDRRLDLDRPSADRPDLPPASTVPLSYVIADLAGEIHELAGVRTGRARVVGDESRGPDARGRWYTRRVVHPTVLIDALAARGWLPAIYFIFSRVGCERAMQDVLTEGKGLLGAPHQREVDTAIGEMLRESPTVAESTLNQSVFEALRLGIGLHHAGILPSLKRLIELALRGADSARSSSRRRRMSLGIHMPARFGRPAGPDQADGPWVSLPFAQRADSDGGPGGAFAGSIPKARASSPWMLATDSRTFSG